MSTSTTNTEIRAYVACLGCYSEGVLNGRWVTAIDAAEVTISSLHKGRRTDHEELWCLDHEGIPYRGELDPWTATRWAEVLGQVEDDQVGALCAWTLNGDYATENDQSDIPDLQVFQETYRGHWDSFTDYARSLVDDLGILQGVSEEIARYWNVEAWARDIKGDHTVVDAAAGVYVFTND